jgi:hypothetical protein
MLNGLERRVSRLEQDAARICNCRKVTRYHNADCLKALLNRIPRVCPPHQFRDLGFLLPMPVWFPLISEDNQFCPCRPDPLRSFKLSKGPHTREDERVARHASLKIPPPDEASSLDDRLRANVLQAKYWQAREQWIEKTGRQLPSRNELAKVYLERMRKADDVIRQIYDVFAKLQAEQGVNPDKPLIEGVSKAESTGRAIVRPPGVP